MISGCVYAFRINISFLVKKGSMCMEELFAFQLRVKILLRVHF
jgi:hypothetical protein